MYQLNRKIYLWYYQSRRGAGFLSENPAIDAHHKHCKCIISLHPPAI